MLHSSHGLAVGDFKYVGIRYFQGTDQHPPLRIFYPAEVLKDASKEIHSKPVGWFAENSLGYVLSGYLHAFGARHDTLVFRWILFPLLYGLSMFFPVRWISIPGVFWEAPVAKSSYKKHPVIVFSHGLLGTGQENSVLLSCWAKRGFVVVSVHHRDGSSCRVPLPDGSSKYYQRGPPFSNYDRNFRLSQIQQRAKEMKQAVSFLRNDFQDCPQEILENVNLTGVVAAGFSYGAATAALAAVEEDASPQLFKGLILLDGWFHIDVSESAGIEFEFPEHAFQSGLKVPTLFVNSAQFRDIPKMYRATCKLGKSKSGTEMHVLEGTTHQNFCDVVFWLPKFLLRRLQPFGVGSANPRKAYSEIVTITSEFLVRNFG